MKKLLPFFLLGILGLGTFIALYNTVSPTVPIRIEVSQEEAIDIATEELNSMGFDTTDYKVNALFTGNAESEIFLQKAWGEDYLENINRYPETTRSWGYFVRFYQPLEVQEYNVGIAADGRTVIMERILSESEEGAQLTSTEALAKAETFATETLQLNLNDYELIDQNDSTLENRVDHSFNWKKKDLSFSATEHGKDLGTLTFTLQIDIQGDEVGYYNIDTANVPEAFVRDSTNILSTGDILTLIANVLSILLVLVIVIMAFLQKKRPAFKIKPFLVIALMVWVVTTLMEMNLFNSWKAIIYDTSIPEMSFLLMTVLSIVVASLVSGTETFFTGILGEDASSTTLKTTSKNPQMIFYSVIRGFACTGIMLGYITVFYLIGQKYFGVWSPVGINQTGALNSMAPFFTPIAVGLIAAFSEEFMYRLFGVSFAKKYLKSTWLALLIPAMIWAFAHSNYPVFPMYMRGIELTIGGLFLGWLFIKYDIMTSIVAHYGFNLTLGVIVLLQSNNETLYIHGLFSLFLGVSLPFFYALYSIQKFKKDPLLAPHG